MCSLGTRMPPPFKLRFHFRSLDVKSSSSTSLISCRADTHPQSLLINPNAYSTAFLLRTSSHHKNQLDYQEFLSYSTQKMLPAPYPKSLCFLYFVVTNRTKLLFTSFCHKIQNSSRLRSTQFLCLNI